MPSIHGRGDDRPESAGGDLTLSTRDLKEDGQLSAQLDIVASLVVQDREIGMMPGVTIETGNKEGDRLVLTGQVMMMGKKMGVKDVISDRTPTSYTLTSYMNDGSGEKKAMTIHFTKRESPADTK